MKLDHFLENFAGEFVDTPASQITFETNYKSLGEWDSLMALTIISMVDEKYAVRITGNELRSCETIRELHDLVSTLK
jgi:acyl carrier protein